MKKFVIGGLVFCTSLAVLYYCDIEKSKAVSKEYNLHLMKVEDEYNLYKIKESINSAGSLSEIEEIYVPEDDKLKAYVSIKKARLLFLEAEKYFHQAVEIENALANSENQSRSINYLTQRSLDKAIGFWEKARKETELIKDDIGDDKFKFHLNYIKGEIYYRTLQFMSDKESSKEVFKQTVTYYRQALKYRPNDINTVVNIELLIKNESELGGGGADNQAKKKQILNSKNYGLGSSSGN